MFKRYPLAPIFLAVILAYTFVYSYGKHEVVASDVALGPGTVSKVESWKGREFTSLTTAGMVSIVSETRKRLDEGNASSKIILWLGNSQLHAINQIKNDDHLAPYWLRTGLKCPDCVVPLGFSLPNSNYQEYLTIEQYVRAKIPLKAIILELAYVQIREDGVRSEFAAMMSPELQENISVSKVGKEIVYKWGGSSNARKTTAASGLQGFAQENYEKFLTDELENRWALWARRSTLYTNVYLDLYFFRNWIFKINPTTVRRAIPSRAERNMAALEEILADSQKTNTPVVVYIAPVRHDLPIPYDKREYSEFVLQSESLSNKYHAKFLNLEKIVPSQHWGLTNGDWVDFMHFQGEGHKLVAEALLPVVQIILDGEGRKD